MQSGDARIRFRYERHGNLVVVPGDLANLKLTTLGGKVSITLEAQKHDRAAAMPDANLPDTMTDGSYAVDSNEAWIETSRATAAAPALGATPPGRPVATPRVSPLAR